MTQATLEAKPIDKGDKNLKKPHTYTKQETPIFMGDS